MRNAPKLKFSQRFYDCTFLVSGYDTIEESASVFVFKDTWQRLEDAKQYAKERNHGSNQAYTTRIGGMEFQIKPHGGDGVAFILSNHMFTVVIRPAKTPFNLSVTYRSRTLWEYGPDKARQMIWDVLMREMKPRPVEEQSEDAAICGWRRISRVDYCFDFHSPEMTGEINPDMIERMVCHSSSKPKWDFKIEEENGYVMGTSSRIQTLTVGKKNTLEIQLYQKSDEITEKSQKTWMYKLWEQAGLVGVRDDVWRMELRFGREYLSARKIDEFEDFEYHREKLICEGLKTRRLTDKSKDSNRRRWPVHPMWSQAIELAGNAMMMLSLDNHKEQAPDALIDKIKQDIKAAIRRQNVLDTGGADYDRITADNLMQEVLFELEEDENHHSKMEEYQERYKYIHEPI